MLSLMDPVELEDLVVFRDDEDPRKFYLLPDQPVIPLDDERQPEFLFIKYQDVGETAEQDVDGYSIAPVIYFHLSSPSASLQLPVGPAASRSASSSIFRVDVDPESPERRIGQGPLAF